MNYTSFSLNGAWEMQYQEEKYTSKVSPFSGRSYGTEDAAGTEPEDMSSSVVENAVPGYWEDMTEKFMLTPFFRELRINPEYGIQQYPMAGAAPDMALPNIVGNFFYRRSFNCENITSPAVIYLEGVQNSASIWINDTFLGRHEGYSTPFEMEIPEGTLKDGENEIVLSVSNHRLEGYAGEPVSGLTSRAANEYTGGVTGDVELRVYNCPLRDVALLVSEDCKTVSVCVESVEKTDFSWAVYDGETLLKKGDADGNFEFDTKELSYWSPESPKLYTLEVKAGAGSIIRQFGVRRLTADGVHFKLNGKPYYLRGICEHCYFPETIHPNHDYTYYRSMIKALKNLGFNFIRFHTFVPEEEYLRAADELGILLHVECPNNTTLAEWEQIVKFARRHTSVVLYCCGNELLMDEPFIEHLHKCGDCVHQYTDSLFSPMNAMRGLEYFWVEPDQEPLTKETPFKHHPGRIANVSQFSDMFSSYPNGVHSYFSLDANPEMIDEWSKVYGKPRVSHEICIDGTYADLSLKDRYKNTRVEKTEMFSSIEKFTDDYVNVIKQKGDFGAFREKYRNVDVLLIDDVQELASKQATQEEFFHTFNDLFEHQRQIVLTSDRHPNEIATLSERLQSRLKSGIFQDIRNPDIEMRTAILQKKAALEDKYLSNEVASYIAEYSNKVNENIRDMEGHLIKIIVYAELNGHTIPTIEDCAAALADNSGDEENARVGDTAARVIATVAAYFSVTPDEITGKRRTEKLADARMVTAYLLTERLKDVPLTEVGEILGGRTHASIIYSRDKIANLMNSNHKLKDAVEDILKQLDK